MLCVIKSFFLLSSKISRKLQCMLDLRDPCLAGCKLKRPEFGARLFCAHWNSPTGCVKNLSLFHIHIHNIFLHFLYIYICTYEWHLLSLRWEDKMLFFRMQS